MNVFKLDDMKFSPTAALFEGLPRAGVGISVFVVRTPPGTFVGLRPVSEPRPPKVRAGFAGGDVSIARGSTVTVRPRRRTLPNTGRARWSSHPRVDADQTFSPRSADPVSILERTRLTAGNWRARWPVSPVRTVREGGAGDPHESTNRIVLLGGAVGAGPSARLRPTPLR
jgi:hypothetical protein